jgi:hypothetical protein
MNMMRQRLHCKQFISVIIVLFTQCACAADVSPYDPALPEGAVCNVKIEELKPTQFAVGKWEVDRREDKIAKMKPNKLNEYLIDHRATIVIGPKGIPYITDGHHLCSVLLKWKRQATVEAKVAANLRNLPPEQFWPTMKEKGWAYLYDENGKGPLDPNDLPKTVAELRDDPYRSLAWAVRERGGWQKSDDDFAEFQWAQFYRPRIKIKNTTSGMENAVEEATKISHSPDAKHLPGYVQE